MSSAHVEFKRGPIGRGVREVRTGSKVETWATNHPSRGKVSRAFRVLELTPQICGKEVGWLGMTEAGVGLSGVKVVEGWEERVGM